MQSSNNMQRNNPWGFQAQNWSQPMSRGPTPHQQVRPNMNRFMSPPGQRPNQGYNQHMGPNNMQNPQMGPPNQGFGPRMSQNQPRFQNNQPFHGNQSQFQRPYQPQHNVQRPVGNQHPGQIFNRPQNRSMTGPPPDFFRAPGNHQQRPRFQKGKHQGDKKNKIDKRDLPENNRFYCDSCDRGYKDEDKYKLHCDQHEKCPRDGCTYIASGKLVQLHIKLQHNSGMAKKIWSLESKEDIKKWRDERKKNFPTAANIEKKKAQLAERIARGEVIEEKYFGKMHRREDNNKRGRGRGRGRDRGRGRGNNRGDVDQHNDLKRKLNDTDNGECSAEKQAKQGNIEDSVMKEAAESLSMFFAADSSDSDSSESEDDNDKSGKNEKGSATSTVPNVTAAGALGNLMSTYDVSDESSDEEDTSKAEKNPSKKTSTNPTSDPGVTKKGKDNQNNNDNKKPRQRNRGRQKKNKDKWNPPPKLDKSLLEKLLAKEIRQERNKIMQCVHYIVKNNFFDNAQNTENKT